VLLGGAAAYVRSRHARSSRTGDCAISAPDPQSPTISVSPPPQGLNETGYVERPERRHRNTVGRQANMIDYRALAPILVFVVR